MSEGVYGNGADREFGGYKFLGAKLVRLADDGEIEVGVSNVYGNQEIFNALIVSMQKHFGNIEERPS